MVSSRSADSVMDWRDFVRCGREAGIWRLAKDILRGRRWEKLDDRREGEMGRVIFKDGLTNGRADERTEEPADGREDIRTDGLIIV